MSRIVIKKRISLDFLGKEYADCYLEFKTIPMKDYERFVGWSRENKGGEGAVTFICQALEELFIGGKFKGEDGELFDVKKEELSDFDVNVLIDIFKTLTGQDQSPN